jgi:hypothetical protein
MIRGLHFAFLTILLSALPSLGGQSISVACTDPQGPTNILASYNNTCVAGGGVAPYTSLVIGQLPAGLSTYPGTPPGNGQLNVTGTPTAAGPYSYTVQFTDSQNQSASQTFSGAIVNTTCALFPGSGSLPQSLNFGPSARSVNLNLRFHSFGCPWVLTTEVPGVTLTPSSGITGLLGTTGQPGATVVVSFAPNLDATPHLGNLFLREDGVIVQTFPVAVNSASCTYSLNPPSVHVGSAGGSGTFSVTANPANCLPFVLLPLFIPDVRNLGQNVFAYAIGPNFGPAQTGAVVIGSGSPNGLNASFAITQDGNDGNGAFIVECPPDQTILQGAPFPPKCYASGGVEPYAWSVNDPRVSVSILPGGTNIVGISPPPASGPYHFTVKVTDSSSPTPQFTTYTVDGTVQSPLPNFTCSSPAALWQTGSGYSIACAPTKGTPPYQWSIASGTLPDGVSLSSAPGGGVTISGIPTTAGDFLFTLQLTDSAIPASLPASQVIAGAILPAGVAPLPLSIVCPSQFAVTIEVGIPMPPTLCGAAGGVPPYSWSSFPGSLPPGLTLSTSPGGGVSIVGTPQVNGVTSFFLKVTDSSTNPQSVLANNTLIVASALGINCPPGPSVLGQLYSVQCISSGGVSSPGYTWWVSAGALPPGIVLSNAIGVFLAGTPTTPGPYNYTISVADSLTPTPATASQTFTGVITPLPAPLDTTKVSGSMAHLAIGDGWSTTTVLINTGTTFAQAQVNYFADDGSPLLLPGSLNEWFTTTPATAQTMPPNATFVIDSAPPASAPLQEGSANLSTDGDVNGFIRFRYAPRDQEAIVPLETRKAGAYLLAFDNTNGIATGVALANLTTGAATIPVVIRDNTGAQLGTAAVQLGAKSHTAFVLSDQFSNVANVTGTIEFDTPPGGQISVLGIRFPPGQRFTTIPVVANTDPGGGSLAHLAVGDGWTTTVELINFGATPAQTHLNFFADDGTPLALPLTYATTSATTSQIDQSMPPHSRLVIQSNALDTAPLATGSAQLTSDGSVSGFIRFRYAPRDQEAIVPLESRNAASYILSFDNTNGLVAGVAVANLSPTTATIPVIIRDITGAELGSSTITLAPNAHKSFVLSDLFNSTANQTGTVEFDAPEASPISVLGFRFPASGAFSTIPVLAP